MMKHFLHPKATILPRPLPLLMRGIVSMLTLMMFVSALLFVPCVVSANGRTYEGRLAEQCINAHKQDAIEGCKRSRMPFRSYSLTSDPDVIKMVVKDKKATVTPDKIKLREIFEYYVSRSGRDIKQVTDFSMSFSQGQGGADGKTIKGTYLFQWIKASGEIKKSVTANWQAVPQKCKRAYLVYLDHDSLCINPDKPWFKLDTGAGGWKPVTLPNILLKSDERVSACLNDATLWQKWLERKAGQTKKRQMEPGYDEVAAKFKEVAKTFKVSQDRRIFWPGALIQSCLETGFFTFPGDADPTKYNLAGIGIPLSEGIPEHQDFQSLERGITAFFQHLSVYSTGETVDEPIADRTRSAQGTISDKTKKWCEQRSISLNDLKAPLPPNVEQSPTFVEFAKRFAGTLEKYYEYKDRLCGTGGTTLSWAGDPFYGVKLMSLWHEATEWIKNQCNEASAITPNAEPSKKPIVTDPWNDIPLEASGQDQSINPEEEWMDVLSPDSKDAR